MLTLVGLGLWNPEDITLKGLEAVRAADIVYFETYTSVFGAGIAELEAFFGKRIMPARRQLVEHAEQLLSEASSKNVVLLVVGDPLVATTHVDLLLRAKEKGISTGVFRNSSVLTAVAETGLQLYKFGKVASIPFAQKDYLPETPYNILKDNLSVGAHTLFLLDLRPDENKFLAVTEAIDHMRAVERLRKENVITQDILCVGCARLGSNDALIKKGSLAEVRMMDFGRPPYCIIIPGKLHFVEEEFLRQF